MPTTDDYGQGVNIASLTDAPDASQLARDIANGIAPRGVMRFASAAARGAALSGATAPVDGMTTWLQDVNRLEVYDGANWVTPEPSLASTTSGLSVAAGFTAIDFYGFRQGRMTTIDCFISRSGGTVNSTNGNIADLVICTLPSGWRPTHSTITSCWDNGLVHGGFVVGVDGICTLRTASDDIASGSTLRLHVAFLKTT
ncbi:hypothetical protein GCM10010317_076700 [Streptomyces mirabilis]|uniref:hypothetical protein n=1 Tax=Streptomyces mirabilis TaxID=68239 RepID=UPI00167E66E8|nr:hypothetical protein [Streptomyces mirabilis]GHD70109.1 hypothetical protein GCM10010317_076700 [Streptomyces mirabilis]